MIPTASSCLLVLSWWQILTISLQLSPRLSWLLPGHVRLHRNSLQSATVTNFCTLWSIMIHLSHVARSQHLKFINTRTRTGVLVQKCRHAHTIINTHTHAHMCKTLTPNLSHSPTSNPPSNLGAVKQSVTGWALAPTLPVVLYLPLTISRVTQPGEKTPKCRDGEYCSKNRGR